MLFVDLHLFTAETTTSSEELFMKYASNINYIYYLNKELHPVFIQYAGFTQKFKTQEVQFYVEHTFKKYPIISFLKLFYKVRKMKADVVLMHGMLHPFKIIWAKLFLSSATMLIVQNHAELPFTGWRRIIQQLAGYCVSGFLFVSKVQAEPWLKRGIIKNKDQVFEIMEGSTTFHLQNLTSELKPNRSIVFIWVGRLDRNKDPMTILRAFSNYTKDKTNLKLWMIYSTSELLQELNAYIKEKDLSSVVELIGYVEHVDLEKYYSAADYFILGSHYEGSGYALCEAMACGCVPIVTKIPSFESMLNRGECGYLFQAGNAEELLSILENLNERDLQSYKKKVLQKFREDLSFEAIAKRMENIISLVAKK